MALLRSVQPATVIERDLSEKEQEQFGASLARLATFHESLFLHHKVASLAEWLQPLVSQ